MDDYEFHGSSETCLFTSYVKRHKLSLGKIIKLNRMENKIGTFRQRGPNYMTTHKFGLYGR